MLTSSVGGRKAWYVSNTILMYVCMCGVWALRRKDNSSSLTIVGLLELRLRGKVRHGFVGIYIGICVVCICLANQAEVGGILS